MLKCQGINLGLPCLIRTHFLGLIWGQVVLEPEQHPKNIHVRTSDDLRAAVESWVSLIVAFAAQLLTSMVLKSHVLVPMFGIFHFLEFNLRLALFCRVTLVLVESVVQHQTRVRQFVDLLTRRLPCE